MLENITKFLSTTGLELAIRYGTMLIYAILTLIVGLWVVKTIKMLFANAISKVIKEEELVNFLMSFVGLLLNIMLFITIASMLGIETTSFMAVLGTIGLAIGLALQGSLTNFAGGVLILLFKPFKKGDFVTIAEEDGFIENIDILATTLKTRLNRIITIPNSKVTSDKIINHFKLETVRRRFYLGISYNSDIEKAKKIILETCRNTKHIIQDPGPFCEVVDLADSSMQIRIFIWVKTEDYFRCVEPCIENIKNAFDEQGIEIPFPQRVLHIKKEDSAF
jgi:small conductance mechanosensitive channel